MVEELAHAQAAAQSENWPLLQQLLPHLLRPETAAELCDRLSLSPSAYWHQVWELALIGLEVGDFASRWELAKAIPTLGEVAIAPLLDLLHTDDTDWELRWFAARILGQMQHPTLIPALVALLQSPDLSPELCQAIAAALINQGPAAIPALTPLLADPLRRELAVQSLAQIRQPEAIAALLQVVQDPEAAIRTTALAALATVHLPEVTPALVAALEDPVAQVRREAVLGLGLRSEVPDLDVVALLQQRLQDAELGVAQQAAIALGRVGTPAAALALVTGLDDENCSELLQIEAIRALGWMGTAAALDSLERMMTPPRSWSPQVQQELIAALARIEAPELKPQALQLLLVLLTRTSAGPMRQAIALALGELGDATAVPTLMQLLADGDEGVGLHAIAALKKLDPATVQPQVASLVQQASEQRLPLGVAVALREWHIGDNSF